MLLENQLKDINYTLSGVLSYGGLNFNYNSTSPDLSELDTYQFEFMPKLFGKAHYTVNNIFDAKMYEGVIKYLSGKKYYEKQTHISDTYKFYDLSGMRVIVPAGDWCHFLIIDQGKNISVVTKKHDYSTFILRDLIKSTLENDKGVMFHSASAVKGDNAVLVVGQKGAGKSTFTFGLANVFDYTMISNDRTYLTHDNRVLSFPIDIRLGKGTINHNEKLKDLITGTPKFIKEWNELVDDGDKIIVYPYDINQKIPMKTGSDGVKLSKLVIPQFDRNLNTGNLHVSVPQRKDKIREILAENCLTPNDPIWLSSLFKNDKYSRKELQEISDAKIEEILKNIEINVIKYRDITKKTKIVREH